MAGETRSHKLHPPHTQTLSLAYFGEKRGTRRAGERGKAALLKLQKVIAHYPTLRELGREDHKFEASLGCSWSHLKTKPKRLNYKFSFQYNYSGFKNKQKNKNTWEVGGIGWCQKSSV